MATNISVYDINNYPDNPKTVTLDLKQVVPLGAYGDEKWVLTCVTSATASGSASIQDAITQYFMAGWAKSNGVNQGPYTISVTQKDLRVSINNSTYRTISLTPQASPIVGSAVAAEMQSYIQGLAATGGLEAGNLAFKNAQVDFVDGRFIITSGSPSSSYTGSTRSSVDVLPGASNDISVHLGLYAPATSEKIAGNTIYQTYVSFPYTSSSGLTVIDVASSSNFQSGDCIGVTDGTVTSYRYVSSVAAGVINVNAALASNYAIGSRIQTLRLQDPEGTPPSVFESIDDAARYMLAGIINQINFA